MCLAFIAAYIALAAEIKRRKLPIDPYNVVAYVAIAGILGAKLWHIVDTPADRLSWDMLHSAEALFGWFRGGFAWFGGFVAGIATLLFFARKYKINLLTMLDVASPAAAIGYAVGRIGCLTSGDGDYGMPTHLPWGMAFPNGTDPTTGVNGICLRSGWPENCAVHPTPIYEFIVMMLVFWYIWRRGKRALQHPLAPGVIVGEFLILSGLSRFFVEFLRINPRIIFGMSNAQFTALLSVVAGAAIVVIVRRRFRKVDPVRKVFNHVMEHGSDLKPEYHRATPECPHPERFSMFDSMTAEVEVLEFLRTVVTTIKPELIVETGTFSGISTLWMAEGLQANGRGRIITCEYDQKVYENAKARFEKSEFASWIELRNESSLEMKVDGTIDLFFSDSDMPIREQEVRRFLPQINPYGLILMHDASSHLKQVREAALKLEREGLISVVLLPTPRGLVVAQKREGRG